MGHTRMHTVAFSLLFIAGASVLAVQASPTCERFVHTYVTVPVRNRVSKATEVAWAKWRVGHPNWKPNPRLRRPKYVMTRKEAVDKVEFACEVPTTPKTIGLFFTPVDFVPPPLVDLTPMQTTQISFPDVAPPEVAEMPPSESSGPPGILLPPYFPPVFGGLQPPISIVDRPAGPVIPTVPDTPPAITPEPSSFVLVALGMLGGWVMWTRRESMVGV